MLEANVMWEDKTTAATEKKTPTIKTHLCCSGIYISSKSLPTSQDYIFDKTKAKLNLYTPSEDGDLCVSSLSLPCLATYLLALSSFCILDKNGCSVNEALIRNAVSKNFLAHFKCP